MGRRTGLWNYMGSILGDLGCSGKTSQPKTCQNSQSKSIFFQAELRTLVFHDTLHFQSFSNTFDNCLLIAYEGQGSVSSIMLV